MSTTANRVLATNHRLQLAAVEQRDSDHWRNGRDPRLFVQTERERRELNRSAAIAFRADQTPKNDLFISHSIRDGSTQEIKRRIISELSRVQEARSPTTVASVASLRFTLLPAVDSNAAGGKGTLVPNPAQKTPYLLATGGNVGRMLG